MSGSTIGSVVGAGIGFVVGGPAGARWGWMIGGLIGGLVDPQVIQGAQWNNQALQGAQDGLPRAIVFGTAPVVGTIMDADPNGPKIGTKKERQGKGGPVVERDTAILTYAIEICDSSELRGTKINGVIAVWEDEKLVYDLRPGTQLSAADSAKWKENKTFYYGEESQLPAPELEAIHGVGNVPAHRGTCYMTATEEDLMVNVAGDPRGRIPTYRFLVSACAPVLPETPAFLGTGQLSGMRASIRPLTPLMTWAGETDTEITSSSSTSSRAVIRYGNKMFALINNNSCRVADVSAITTWGDGPTGLALGNGVGNASVVDGCLLVACGNLGIARLNSPEDASFTPMTNMLPLVPAWKRSIIGVTGSGTNILCMDWAGAFYSSSDSGASWAAAADIFGSGSNRFYTNYGAMDVNPATGRIVVAGGESGLRAAYTDDNGASFTNCSLTPGTDEYGNQVKYCGSSRWLIACREAATATAALYKSTDDGETFTAVTLPVTINFNFQSKQNIAVDGMTGRVVIAGQEVGMGASRRYYYSDNLDSWTEISTAGTAATGISEIYPLDNTGTELPDAHGYYVDGDGNVIGPDSPIASLCGAPLDQVVRKLHKLGAPQLSDADFDLSALSADIVPGFVIQDATVTAADACEPLRRVWMFDMPSYDLKIRAIKRGGAIGWALDADDLIAGEDGNYDIAIRGQSVEYPRKLHFGYLDPEIEYKPTTQVSERYSSSVRVVGEEKIDSLLVLDKDTAKQAATCLLKIMWTEREDSRSFTVPIDYMRAASADVFEFESRRYRIEKMRIEGSRVVIDQAMYDRASNYTSDATGVAGQSPPPPAGSVRGPTVSAYMCLPALRVEDDAAGIYWAASGMLAGWRGAYLQLSRDGVTFADAGVSTDGCTMGALTAPLATASRYAQDWANELKVSLTATNSGLESATFSQLVANANVGAILYADGTAEIIQWQTAVENTPNNYTLAGLLRGRLNTVIAAHDAGAQFVLLDDSIRFVPLRPEDAGNTITLRAVTNGTSADANSTATVAPEFVSLTEWAPYLVLADIDSGTLSATWVGRGRLGTSRLPQQSMRFAEYRLTADDGTTTIIETSGSQSVSVSAGALTEPFTATVAALSTLSADYNSPEGS